MLLLTGATGTIGMPLLRRLLDAGAPVRCLVRDPRRLGPQRVRVQIALGDLSDHRTFRHALRGVDTVVHLASAIRDQPSGTIEELAGVATWQLVRAAERAGATRFIFFSTTGASALSPSRLMRAKTTAERALTESTLEHTIFTASWVYARDDPFMRVLRRMSHLPVIPIAGDGAAAFEPIHTEDVVECVLATLPGTGTGTHATAAIGARYELAGPEILSYAEITRIALRSMHRRRPLLHVPTPLVKRSLRAIERALGPTAFATWDEAELLTIPLLSANGAADAERLGVLPQSMRTVLEPRRTRR